MGWMWRLAAPPAPALGVYRNENVVDRPVKSASEELRDFRQFQNVAKTWVAEIGKNPEGDTARLMLELIKTFGLKTMLHLGHQRSNPMDLKLLGRFVAHVVRAEKTLAERDEKVDARTEGSIVDRQSETDDNQAGGPNP